MAASRWTIEMNGSLFSLSLSRCWCLFATHLSQLFVRSKMNQSMESEKKRTKRKEKLHFSNFSSATWRMRTVRYFCFHSTISTYFLSHLFFFLLPLLLSLLLVVREREHQRNRLDLYTHKYKKYLFHLYLIYVFSPRSNRSTSITILLLFIVRKDEEIEVVSCSFKMENNIVVIVDDIVDIVDGKLHSRFKWQ